MYSKISISLLLFLSCNVFAINFKNYSLDESLAKAKSENKKVFVFYSAIWCLPCDMMKSSVFQDIKVAELLDESMIPVMVYYDEDVATEWIGKFEVKCLPTSLVLDFEGKVLSRYEGGMNTKRFIAFINNETWIEPTKNVASIASQQQNTFDSKTIVLENPTTQVANDVKIIVDGVLVSAYQSSNIEPISMSTNTITHENQNENLDFKYVIQYGAFNSLEKVKLHQKNIKLKLKEETMIVVDTEADKFPYKLVSKFRFKQNQIDEVVKTLKAKGLDCFPKSI